MNKLSDMKWKYLRESKNRFYDPDRNTSLDEYLNEIFPENDFVYNKVMSKDVVNSRNSELDYKRYRPDVRSEMMNMIIEFDGVDHYKDQNVVISDTARDIWFRSLGYTVIRIPYWIQLSDVMILHYFGIQMDNNMCELKHSFFDTTLNDCGLSISVGSMSEAGRYRFLETVTSYPLSAQILVYEDLMYCIDKYDGNREYILPSYIEDMWTQYTPELSLSST